MYLLKNLGIAPHNAIFHVLYRFFLILQITCTAMLLSFSVSYANEYGATVLTVPVAMDDFPDGQKELETLFHHETGLKKPRIYKSKASQYCKNAMQFTPNWLKSHYGTLPLFSVKKESATQVQLSQYSLSQAIELIESDECQNDVSFVSVFDKTIAYTLKKCKQLLAFQGTRKSFIHLLAPELLEPVEPELLEPELFSHPLNYEEKQCAHNTSYFF